jgi:hypothetical protein
LGKGQQEDPRIDGSWNPQRYASAQGEELEGVDWK